MYKISNETINFENLELTAEGKKLSRSKDPEIHIPGRCTITITIYNSDDATQPHTLEMHRQKQTESIASKDQPPNVCGRH